MATDLLAALIERHPDVEVWAAGGVLTRGGPDGGEEVLLVHRPRYGDWSFPKGKLDPGEGLEEAAHREVFEEVGLRCTAGEQLPMVRYRDDKGREKAVVYWRMNVLSGSFTANDEVDEVAWLPVSAAVARLTRTDDADLLGRLSADGDDH